MTTLPKPLTLTIADHTQTRNQPCHMRWPLDWETTERLRRVIGGGDNRLPLVRRPLRWLKRIRQLPLLPL